MNILEQALLATFIKVDSVPFPAPMLENTHMHDIHREPKPGALPAPGNRREKEKYIFVGGKRVSTGRASRFSAR